MSKITQTTKEIKITTAGNVPETIFSCNEPVILRGLVKNWPLRNAGLDSDEAAIDYLKTRYNGKPSIACFGKPEIHGRFFYQDDITALNYQTVKTTIDDFLEQVMLNKAKKNPSSFYIASNYIDSHFPNFRADNDLNLTEHVNNDLLNTPDIKIWLGNATLACCHYDTSDNIACCVVGNRQFTLFPPSQINNLYPGPLELNPGGPAISMVNFKKPDFEKHPRFKEAIAHGQIANLTPGDALYLPRMWWHQVEGLSPFNVLVNYWWNKTPKYMGEAMSVLQHALLSLKDRPMEEKKAWQHVFNYYIFSDTDHAGAHLPEQAKGALGKIDNIQARKLRAQLIHNLNR